MAVKTLVDGLNITEELTMGDRCEDCIFGKHSTHPFNDNGYQEMEILERTHINIWGPSPTQSAGADVTLNVFKTYHNEAERQTGKKLKRIRLDMGREWYNKAWEEYRKRYGLIFEFTTPYAHQQNGMVERSLQTILDSMRTAMAESGLPTKYWADAV